MAGYFGQHFSPQKTQEREALIKAGTVELLRTLFSSGEFFLCEHSLRASGCAMKANG